MDNDFTNALYDFSVFYKNEINRYSNLLDKGYTLSISDSAHIASLNFTRDLVVAYVLLEILRYYDKK